jgi:hypothetical protein
MITVIIPTISGREDSLKRVVAAYRRMRGLQIVTPKDYPNWPAGCNAGQLQAKGDILHFGADDLEPIDGWAEPMLECLSNGYIPAPQLWNWVKEGEPVNQAEDGLPGSFTTFSRVPALTREMAKAIGPWPEIPYYADNWVSLKGSKVGYLTRVTGGYSFIHHWSQIGRLDQGDWVGRYLPLYEAEVAKL